MTMVMNRAGRLAMAALAALGSAAAIAQNPVIKGVTDERGNNLPSTQNGGRSKTGNRHHQRQALKARNVRKHRKASRGRA